MKQSISLADFRESCEARTNSMRGASACGVRQCKQERYTNHGAKCGQRRASGAACVLCPAKSMRAVMRCVVVTPGEYPRFVHALCAVAVLPRSFALPHSTPYSPTTAVFEVPDELRFAFSMKRSHDKVRGRGGWRVPGARVCVWAEEV